MGPEGQWGLQELSRRWDTVGQTLRLWILALTLSCPERDLTSPSLWLWI